MLQMLTQIRRTTGVANDGLGDHVDLAAGEQRAHYAVAKQRVIVSYYDADLVHHQHTSLCTV